MTAAIVTAATIAMVAGVFSDAIPNVCQPDGSSRIAVRYPHECFCDEYYECSSGEMVRKDCSVGKFFDQESGSCVPWDATNFNHCEGWEPSARNCPAYGETTLPHETDCSSFYRCKDGQKTLSSCKGGLQFDESKGLCTWRKEPCAAKPRISGGSPRILKAVDLVCPPAGSNTTVRLPHPCRCDLYYECVDGDAIYNECPKGLEFDYVKGTCDDPSIVHCIRPIPSNNTTTSTTQTPTTTSTTQAPTTTSTTPAPTTTSTTQAPTTTSTTPAPTTTSTTQAPTTTSTTPAPTTTSTTQAPTTTSTTQAPTTTSTTPAPTTTSTTPAPTTTSTTQAPTTTSTTQALTTTLTTQAPTTTSTTQAPTTTLTTQAPTTTSTTPAPTVPPIIPDCPRDCLGIIRLPNPADCSSYYECHRGRRRLLRCPIGLWFNRLTEMCDWPWSVKCY